MILFLSTISFLLTDFINHQFGFHTAELKYTHVNIDKNIIPTISCLLATSYPNWCVRKPLQEIT